MCGIFGYVGTHTAAPILLDGLRTLEYRGYDSAGIFVPGYGAVRAVGPIDALQAKCEDAIPGTSGIAHTRWATHGAPTEANAHPHTDMSETIWVVHNGIIENYQELKTGLQAQGIKFYSETDTEVLAKLIGSLYQGDLRTAVQTALARVHGAYGLVAQSEHTPGELIVARMGSPIVLGLAPAANLVASDVSALLAHTKDVVYLDDGELAVVTSDSYNVYSWSGDAQTKTPEVVTTDATAIQKDGYAHFMEKEMFEAPQVLQDTVRGRLLPGSGRVKLGGLETVLSELNATKQIDIVGCGSAYYAGSVGQYLFEQYAGIPTTVDIASEYRYRVRSSDAHTTVLAISQSGETADTLAAIARAKANKQLTLGVINTVGSTIARTTDAGVYNHIGPEIAVASTKAFISQLAVLAMMAVHIGRERNLDMATGKEIVDALKSVPEALALVLKEATHIKQIAEEYAQYSNMLFIGRQQHAPIAAEAALKLKEVSYIHAEAYPAGELKHGPLALLDEHMPVVAIAPQDDTYEKMVSNIQEVRARQAPVLAVVTKGDTTLSALATHTIEIPLVHPAVQSIVSTLPLHMFAYYVGVAKGLNVDRPRNLAKSVTVE